ncbi:MAG TPA: nuclear transport factor 2 family protein [Chthoniobacteraceae bacterium]|nr:nuclear transport factor 2 family protein [Chthoniobacteraceae bacterium]
MRRHFLNGAVVLVALAIVLLWHWQPARQVRRHNDKLLEAVESKDWKDLSELMADDYSDRWHHDKALVLERSKMVFAQFFVMEIAPSEIEVVESNGIGVVRAKLALTGRGGPLAELAIQRAATLQQPFVFEWRQASWKPWHWVLSKLDQPELEIEMPEF